MRIRMRLATIGVALVASGVIGAGAASPAQALPSDCEDLYYGYSYNISQGNYSYAFWLMDLAKGIGCAWAQ